MSKVVTVKQNKTKKTKILSTAEYHINSAFRNTDHHATLGKSISVVNQDGQRTCRVGSQLGGLISILVIL